MRELADYDARSVFSADDARAELADACGLEGALEEELRTHGVTVPRI